MPIADDFEKLGDVFLKTALAASGLVPGLAQAKTAMQIADAALPAIPVIADIGESAVKQFMASSGGQEAVKRIGVLMAKKGMLSHDPQAGTLIITSDAAKPDFDTPSDPTFYGN